MLFYKLLFQKIFLDQQVVASQAVFVLQYETSLKLRNWLSI